MKYVRRYRSALTCSKCGRRVPVAPHYHNVSAPHVSAGLPCDGNEKRIWRDDLTHPAERLALQWHVLDTDEYWEDI